MTPKELFDAGKVRDAERELTAYLRDHPTDVKQRTFLFELLCFSGDYARAEKQLGVLSGDGPQAELGAVLYYSALHAEKTRHALFENQDFPTGTIHDSPVGTLNDRPFRSLRDCDPNLGARLEVFAAGAYLWIPFEHISSIEMEPPRRLRDMLWRPAMVQTGPSFHGTELGEVLIPSEYPFSWKHPDEAVWLGRVTAWASDESGTEYPSGQRIWLMDGEEVPFLEVTSVKFSDAQPKAGAATN